MICNPIIEKNIICNRPTQVKKNTPFRKSFIRLDMCAGVKLVDGGVRRMLSTGGAPILNFGTTSISLWT